MAIAISSGHGLHVRGASGDPVPPQLDEVDEARRLVDAVAHYLRLAGVDCETFHDDTSHDVSTNLDAICDWHNQQDRTLDVSIHFNAFDGNAHGTEVCWYTQEALAAKVSEAISEAGGFTNRGPKFRDDLKFLKATDQPAILIETCFCDNTGDSTAFKEHFESIAGAIAAAISGQDIEAPPPGPEEPPYRPERPQRPQRPSWPDRPESTPIEERPTLREGDDGEDVLDMQRMIPRFTGAFDGDFGPTTKENVVRYQYSRGLVADGICGQQTWEALYDHALPVPLPPPPPGALTPQEQIDIMEIANESDIADYIWDDRGVAPTGFTQGMALSFAQTLKKLLANHPAAVEMAKARTDSDKDVFNVYRDEFNKLGMSNERAGVDTLRHLYAFMLGSGMRESSGQHCCGRDQSASNTDSDTCEAGFAQTSYNASSASNPEFDQLMNEFLADLHPGFLEAFSEGVSCSSSDWENYGSGRGRDFQELCKTQPAFAAETHALTLRNLCNHYGPVIRKEVELVREADEMFKTVQEYLETEGEVA
jgi:peptidoglycan hydrolase-like protein with peptidoglycan-binding domain